MKTNKLVAWRKEYIVQKKEHPKLPDWAIRQVASDHIKIGKKMKGGIMDWVAALSGLAIVSILWIIFSAKLFYPQLLPMAQTITDPEAVQTVALFNTIWTAWPFVMIIGFVLLVIVAAQRRSPEYI
jgi:hypothetical protein